MSSYQVEPKTIARILSFIDQDNQIWCTRMTGRNPLANLGYNFEDIKEMDRLGSDLLAMNAQAVGERYNEPVTTIQRYKHNNTMVTQEQAFSSVSCLLYQCSEGAVPETALYKALAEVRDAIARSIAFEACDKAGTEWA